MILLSLINPIASKELTKLQNKLFKNLYDKNYLSSLGRKVKKPKFPKSLYPVRRLSSMKKKRPSTAAIYRLHNSATRLSFKEFKYSPNCRTKISMSNDYTDGYNTFNLQRSRQHQSFDKRSSSAHHVKSEKY